MTNRMLDAQTQHNVAPPLVPLDTSLRATTTGVEPAPPFPHADPVDQFPKVAFWYPFQDPTTGRRSCVHDADYPDEYMATAAMLFDTEYDCCTTFYVCGSDPTATPTPPPVEPEMLLSDRWYPKVVDGMPSCVYDDLYDPTYANEVFAGTFLFDTAKECCDTFPLACSLAYVDDVTTTTVATATTEEASTVTPGENSISTVATTTTEEASTVTPAQAPVDEVATAATSAMTTAEAATTMVEPAPAVPHTDPVSQFHNVAFWYPIEEPTTGHKSCVHNADYPTEYIRATTVLLFDTEYDCCTTYDACGSSSEEPAPPALIKLELWHPVEVANDAVLAGEGGGVSDECVLSSDYPDWYLEPSTAPLVLFHAEAECCAAYGCNVVVPDHWYPKLLDGMPFCVYDGLYDPTYARGGFLFESEAGCCETFPVACNGRMWYPDDDGTGCAIGPYRDDDADHLFMTKGECLAYVEGGTTITEGTTATEEALTVTPGEDYVEGETTTTEATTATEEASTVTPAEAAADPDTTIVVTKATTATTVDPCTECIWHESHTRVNTCTNSLEYPLSFEQGRPYFFHHTAQDCCDMKFPDDCTIVDDGTPNGGSVASAFTELTGDVLTEDFEDGAYLAIPFDLGTPPQWERSPLKSRSGAWSLANIPVEGHFATSDLVVKVEVPQNQSYTVNCRAIIGTSMPYENFALYVNGEPRNTYQRIAGDEDNWVDIITGIGPGPNTLIFRVTNSDIDPSSIGPERQSDHFGAGLVHLDDCELTPNGSG